MLCAPCKNGDNGMRCLTKDESDRQLKLETDAAAAAAKTCGGGEFDPFLLYILLGMAGIGLILLIVLLVRTGGDNEPPTKVPTKVPTAPPPVQKSEPVMIDPEPNDTIVDPEPDSG
jgi:hypothetical protein